MELPEKSGLPQIEFPDRRPALRPLRTAVSMARARAIPRCASVLNIISRRVNHEHARRRADTERENFDPENRRIPAPGDPHNRRNRQGAEPLPQTGHGRVPATRLDAGNRGSVDIGGTGRVHGRDLESRKGTAAFQRIALKRPVPHFHRTVCVSQFLPVHAQG